MSHDHDDDFPKDAGLHTAVSGAFMRQPTRKPPRGWKVSTAIATPPDPARARQHKAGIPSQSDPAPIRRVAVHHVPGRLGRPPKPRTAVEAYCLKCRAPAHGAGKPGGNQLYRCTKCLRTFSSHSSKNSERIDRARVMFLDGYSIKMIATELKCSVGLVKYYYSKLFPKGGTFCRCGKPTIHRGLCQWRISQSKGRQDYLAAVTKKSGQPRSLPPRLACPFCGGSVYGSQKVRDGKWRMQCDHCGVDFHQVLAENLAGVLRCFDLLTGSGESLQTISTLTGLSVARIAKYSANIRKHAGKRCPCGKVTGHTEICEWKVWTAKQAQEEEQEFESPYPARPGECDCKVCENGYIRIPNWDKGRYVYVHCSDERHKEGAAEAAPDNVL